MMMCSVEIINGVWFSTSTSIEMNISIDLIILFTYLSLCVPQANFTCQPQRFVRKSQVVILHSRTQMEDFSLFIFMLHIFVDVPGTNSARVDLYLTKCWYVNIFSVHRYRMALNQFEKQCDSIDRFKSMVEVVRSNQDRVF